MAAAALPLPEGRKRKPLTDEELEDRRRKVSGIGGSLTSVNLTGTARKSYMYIIYMYTMYMHVASFVLGATSVE